MSELSFADKVLIEQVRCLEEESESEGLPEGSTLLSAPIDLNRNDSGNGFTAALLQRAKAMVRGNDWQAALDKPARLHKAVVNLALLAAAVLGFLAIANALSNGADNKHAINIYWLLIVLLGFNLLSIGLWCVGTLTSIGDLISGSIAKLPLSVFQRFSTAQAPAARAWYACSYSNRYGLWHFSSLNHLLWLVYLLAGLLSLLLFLSAQQYDFYWGSTLLSADTFLSLTNALAAPLASLGFTVPDASQISLSREGLGDGNAVSRQQWAMFLVGALLLYGLLPRLICWFIATACKRRAAQQFSLDLYLPYYVDLRHQSSPVATEPTVVDPDDVEQQPVAILAKTAVASVWQKDCVRIGLELAAPINMQAKESVALNVVDKASLDHALTLLANKPKSQGVAVLVGDGQAPDRGLQRQLRALLSNDDKAWLILLAPETTATDDSLPVDKQRLADWYKTAQLANVDAAHVQYLDKIGIAQLVAQTANGGTIP